MAVNSTHQIYYIRPILPGAKVIDRLNYEFKENKILNQSIEVK